MTQKSRKNSDNILVIAAHPDDEVLGCGGAIARYSKLGNMVYCLILGEGSISRCPTREEADFETVRILKKQAQIASNVLGIKKISFSRFPDNSFDSVPILKIIKEIENVKSIIKPNIIYTHHYGDLNIDHRITYNAVMAACRPLKKETVKEIYSFEILSSTEWSGPNKDTIFIPDRFIDISEEIDEKIEALKCYKKELRPYPHPRSGKGVKVLAARRGLEVNLKFAEAFKTVRAIIN